MNLIKHWHKCRKCGARFLCSLAKKVYITDCTNDDICSTCFAKEGK